MDFQKPTFKQVGNKRHAQEASQSVMEAEIKVADQGKPKFCFRCFSKGHDRMECENSVFCENCESQEHVKQKCPSKKLPKNIVQWVGHALDGNGFFHIPHAPIKSANDNRTAKITLDGGSLSIEQLIIELQARIPCQSSWN